MLAQDDCRQWLGIKTRMTMMKGWRQMGFEQYFNFLFPLEPQWQFNVHFKQKPNTPSKAIFILKMVIIVNTEIYHFSLRS